MRIRTQGYVQRGCLWQLLEEGQLNARQLACAIESAENIVMVSLQNLAKAGLVSMASQKQPDPLTRHKRIVFGLTRLGIEHALLLEPEDASASARGAPAAFNVDL